MPLEALSLAQLTSDWGSSPRRGMLIDVRDVARGLLASPTSPEAVSASHQLAMQLGDTGAPELCFAVVEHRQQFQLSNEQHDRLEAHRRMALLDLGLATAKHGDIQLRSIVQEVEIDLRPVAVFRQTLLEPVGGSLDTVVELAIRLAAIRVDLLPRPEAMTVAAVLALPHPGPATES